MTRYAEPGELRGRIEKSSTVQDIVLGLILDAASELIDKVCNRPQGFKALETATPFFYPGDGGTVLYVDDCIQVTEVAVKDSPTDAGYVVWESERWVAACGDPRRPNFNKLPHTFIMVSPIGGFGDFTSGRFTAALRSTPSPTVRVTAKWGYSAATPPIIKEATIAQASRWFSRGKSGWADTLASAEFGMMQFRTVMDPDIRLMLVEGRLVKPTIGRR